MSVDIDRLFEEMRAEREADRQTRAELLAKVAELTSTIEKLVEQERLLVGWPEIAQEAGLSTSQAKAEARAPVDPLPYFLEAGRAMSIAGAVRAWRRRRRVVPGSRGRTRMDSRRSK